MKKKIIAHLSIILILSGVFCNVCTTYNSISIYDSSVYAEADNWSSCDSSDLVTAFRYYCKSRNLALEGSAADALTTFTTSTFNNICSTLGIDPTTLSAELKKTTDGNLGLRFLFSNTGITAYNRIFAEFLQNNDLSVGDSVDNEVIYSGDTIDGHFIYVLSSYDSATNDNPVVKYGTDFYDGLDIYNNVPQTITFYGDTRTSSTYSFDGFGYRGRVCELGNIVYRTGVVNNGGICLARLNSENKIFRCAYNVWTSNKATSSYPSGTTLYLYSKFGEYLTDTNTTPTDITVNTPNNTVINNNTYNNTYVIIYTDGDTYISDDDDEPLPTTPPSGDGGGGGGDNPDNPDIPPVDPTPTPNPTIPDWDIELPDMPVGNDWLLYGLEKKFPWDIPYNLMYMLSLFAADPETPHFEGTIDLKIVQWNYDIDLAPFDDIAGYVRDIEFIGFLLGLMLLTRKLIWG